MLQYLQVMKTVSLKWDILILRQKEGRKMGTIIFVEIPGSPCQVSMLKMAEGRLGSFLIPQKELGDQKYSEF